MMTKTNDQSPRLLLVDDAQEDLQLLVKLLRVARFRLIVSSDGRQGYQRAVVDQPDLILMDVSMPQLDGYGACRLLKADPATRHIPIIFLSAKNTPEERLQGLRLGGADYVSKPFLAEEVMARIAIHLPRPPASRPTQIGATATTMTAATGSGPDEVIFQAALVLIADSLGALPPLPEIAHRVGTHEKKLGQIFRHRLGMTVSGFVGEQRIRQACQLLANTDMAVQGIAEQVGFTGSGNFATAFRERMGMSPSAYRQAMHNQGNTPCSIPSSKNDA